MLKSTCSLVGKHLISHIRHALTPCQETHTRKHKQTQKYDPTVYPMPLVLCTTLDPAHSSLKRLMHRAETLNAEYTRLSDRKGKSFQPFSFPRMSEGLYSLRVFHTSRRVLASAIYVGFKSLPIGSIMVPFCGL